MSEYANHDRVAALRVDMYDCEKPPREYLASVEPPNATRSAWIPQTIADQIWVLYEFPTAEARIEWEATLPADVARWLDRRLLPHAMSYGWQTRDENGFPRA